MVLGVLFLFGCGEEGNGQPESYQMPTPTEENLEWFREWTRKSLVFVEGGTFMMGDVGMPDSLGGGAWTSSADTEPAHKVTLSSYSIQKYEVTYWEYDLFTNATGRDTVKKKALGHRERSGRYPVSVPIWENARAYCEWAGKQIGVEMDLPTEAQWEYAARSRGKNVAVATNDGMPRPGENMIERMDVQPIGTYPPNPLGLHNMSDNVREWTRDWYDENYYEVSPRKNPTGPDREKNESCGGGQVLWIRLSGRAYITACRGNPRT
ncbi:hypothetical protein BSZ35_04085 [Salinibacter sp. 10B]|nr:hypothetical protein BSZ35_04085 [Salinibacter sp. 10B]